jgi:hypothetical protein
MIHLQAFTNVNLVSSISDLHTHRSGSYKLQTCMNEHNGIDEDAFADQVVHSHVRYQSSLGGFLLGPDMCTLASPLRTVVS